MPELLLLLAIFGGIGGWTTYQLRLMRAAGVIHQRLQAEGALLSLNSFSAAAEITTLGESSKGWRSAVIALTGEGIVVYPRKRGMDERYTFAHQSLRWFGRPEKYQPGKNEIWLHYQLEDRWQVVKLKMYSGAMADWVRMFKEFARPELIVAYRRRRPYVHYGPVRVQPAEEDIYGAWMLHDPVTLYLMPMAIVVLQGPQVKRTIPLEKIAQVSAMRRLDRPDADGLVMFQVGDERLAFACKEYQQVGEAIAEAAKRSLEQPLMQKQKGKDEDIDDDGETDQPRR